MALGKLLKLFLSQFVVVVGFFFPFKMTINNIVLKFVVFVRIKDNMLGTVR